MFHLLRDQGSLTTEKASDIGATVVPLAKMMQAGEFQERTNLVKGLKIMALSLVALGSGAIGLTVRAIDRCLLACSPASTCAERKR